MWGNIWPALFCLSSHFKDVANCLWCSSYCSFSTLNSHRYRRLWNSLCKRHSSVWWGVEYLSWGSPPHSSFFSCALIIQQQVYLTLTSIKLQIIYWEGVGELRRCLCRNGNRAGQTILPVLGRYRPQSKNRRWVSRPSGTPGHFLERLFGSQSSQIKSTLPGAPPSKYPVIGLLSSFS